MAWPTATQINFKIFKKDDGRRAGQNEDQDSYPEGFPCGRIALRTSISRVSYDDETEMTYNRFSQERINTTCQLDCSTVKVKNSTGRMIWKFFHK
jgi:hypothetical protein